MSNVIELPKAFNGDMKVGDEMILLGDRVRITEIELVVRVKTIDMFPKHKPLSVSIPMTDFKIPFLEK